MKKENKGQSIVVPDKSLPTLTMIDKENYICKVAELKKEVGNFKITDDYSREKASQFLSRIKAAMTWLEDKRKHLVDPYNKEVKGINNEFKFIVNPLTEMEALIKSELKRDYEAQERIRIEAERKAREEEAKKLAELQKQLKSKNQLIRSEAENKAEAIQIQTEQTLQSIEPKTIIRSAEGKTSFRKIWQWKVVDFSILPDEYKTTAVTIINAAVKSGKRNIPGLDIYEETIVGGGR